MRVVTAILSVAAVVSMAAGVIAQAKPSFAGEWKMVAANGQGDAGVDLIITQGAESITVEYKRGGPARSKATWVANNLVVITTTGTGEEKRTFSIEGGNLVVETSARTRKGGAPTITKVTYQRYQRGHGG
jgi:hypothetical protein